MKRPETTDSPEAAATPASRRCAFRAALLDVPMQIVLLEVQLRIELLDIERDRERPRSEERLEIFRERREQPLSRLLAHLERPAVADERGDVHERVRRIAVCNAVTLGAMRTDSEPADREYAGLERGGVERVHQAVEIERLLEIRRVLDDQMRHAFPPLPAFPRRAGEAEGPRRMRDAIAPRRA